MFRLFELFVFFSLERHFSALEYYKLHFPGLVCLIKIDGKMGNLDNNHGLTPWKNLNFLYSLNFLFLQPTKVFLALEYYKTHFPYLVCLIKKDGKWPILDNYHAVTLWKNLNFSTF